MLAAWKSPPMPPWCGLRYSLQAPVWRERAGPRAHLLQRKRASRQMSVTDAMLALRFLPIAVFGPVLMILTEFSFGATV